jgi:small subunit ribosomal protein S4
MARYTGPATRISRRLNTDLVGGDTSFERRPYPPGQHGRSRIKQSEYLLQILESRLDNVVYRSGLARTRRGARQLVSHGHFLVNGEKVNIPSYRVSQYDIIDIKPKSLETTPFLIARETQGDRPIPGWLQVVPNRLRVLVHQLPERSQIDVPLQEQLIVELYSK